jgi:nitrogen-specific signal transduction histidine kinase
VGQGTGLGLDIVRRLLDQNNATIDVDSAPGRTEFRVALPT